LCCFDDPSPSQRHDVILQKPILLSTALRTSKSRILHTTTNTTKTTTKTTNTTNNNNTNNNTKTTTNTTTTTTTNNNNNNTKTTTNTTTNTSTTTTTSSSSSSFSIISISSSFSIIIISISSSFSSSSITTTTNTSTTTSRSSTRFKCKSKLVPLYSIRYKWEMAVQLHAFLIQAVLVQISEYLNKVQSNVLLQSLPYSSSDFTFPSATGREIAKVLSTISLHVRTQQTTLQT